LKSSSRIGQALGAALSLLVATFALAHAGKAVALKGELRALVEA
jgi:hypothetical protein